MEDGGVILDCKVDIEAVGGLESDDITNKIPFRVLFATILEPDIITAMVEVDDKNIFEVSQNMSINPLDKKTMANEEPLIQEEDTPQEKPSELTESEDTYLEDNINQEEDFVSVQPVQENSSAEDRIIDENSMKKATSSITTETSLRVNVSLLDSLMNLAGELVLGRNQLLQAVASKDYHGLETSGQRLDLITSELQEAIMLTRMQPISNVFSKFPRVVRDLAQNLGKEVELTIEGKGVELDKTIIEAISDPLTHLVRNAVDHGLEVPEQRRKAGKDVTGHVRLKAFHEAGQVNIEISDDGQGMDGNKLAALAVVKGLISEKQVKGMTNKEKVNLVFLPGFSTAKEVTDVSGRGVGMDVVKTNLDKLGGVVEIDSKIGKGSLIKIKLPLTLAIIPSQIITVCGERYAIPQVNLEELFRIPADQVKERIEKVGDADVVRLRGNLLPLVRLADILDIDRKYYDNKEKREKDDRRHNIADRRSKQSLLFEDEQESDGEEKQTNGKPLTLAVEENQTDDENGEERRLISDRRYHASSAVNVVVVSTGAFKYGLVVDELRDSEEIVVKPLGRHLKDCKGYAGATIMGDGRVALILDVAGLAMIAELVSLEGTDRALEVAKENIEKRKDMQSMLIFRNADDEQFAVPLSLVERIEKIKCVEIEEVGGKKVIQYRGASLPLFALEEVASVRPREQKEELLVIVFMLSGREIGLIAVPPVDAIEEMIDIDDITLKQTGIMGSAIIGEQTTLMVDIYDLVHSLNPEWFTEAGIKESGNGKKATILYAEDSNFFRSQIKDLLEDKGYEVLEAEDGIEAWSILSSHKDKVNLLLTDIEMPNLDGFGLVERIRQDDAFIDLPIIALTTMASEEHLAKGKAVGIDDYQIKLDKAGLLDSIHSFLKSDKTLS
jgi:two-component system chemotaxis sensor kinase CheA